MRKARKGVMFLLTFAMAFGQPGFTQLQGIPGSAGIGAIETEAAEATYSPNWYQEADGRWRLKNTSGGVVTNAWVCDDAVLANGKNVWYLLDANGYMIADPLVQDSTGNYYSLETRHEGYYGMLRYNSGVYDGVNLVLSQSHDGGFARIMNQDGLAAMTAKYPVKKINIDNSNIVYTSSFGTAMGTAAGTTRKSSGGGGGGGGGSSSSGSGSSGGSGSGGSGSGGSHSSGTQHDDYVDEEWKDYDDDTVRHAANDFKTGNDGMMTKEQRSAVNEKIAEFKETYINDGMTDFEKETTIIGWLVENCVYEASEVDWGANSTAYGCIVNGKAQCSGYADAFLHVAQACGIDARYVHNATHAWNLVQIDDEWYHVDVTWEDPVTSDGKNGYKIGNLRNYYINLTDKLISRVGHHYTWSPTTIKATGGKWADTITHYYLKTGKLDTSMTGDNWRRYYLKNDLFDTSPCWLYYYGYRFDDGSNYIDGDDIQNKTAAYVDIWLTSDNYRDAYVVFPESADVTWLTPEWLRTHLGNTDAKRVWKVSKENSRGDDSSVVYEINRPYSNSLSMKYIGLAEQKKKYDAAASSGSLFNTKEEAVTYFSDKVTTQDESITAIFKGDAVYTADDLLKDHAAEVSAAKHTMAELAVNGELYSYVTYDVTYNTLYSKSKVTKDGVTKHYLEKKENQENEFVNLFAAGAPEKMEYLQSKIDAGATDILVTQTGNNLDNVDELQKYADENGITCTVSRYYRSTFTYENEYYYGIWYKVKYGTAPEKKVMLKAASPANAYRIDRDMDAGGRGTASPSDADRQEKEEKTQKR